MMANNPPTNVLIVSVLSAFETYGAICPPRTVAGTVNTTIFHGVEARLMLCPPTNPPPKTCTTEARTAVNATTM